MHACLYTHAMLPMACHIHQAGMSWQLECCQCQWLACQWCADSRMPLDIRIQSGAITPCRHGGSQVANKHEGLETNFERAFKLPPPQASSLSFRVGQPERGTADGVPVPLAASGTMLPALPVPVPLALPVSDSATSGLALPGTLWQWHCSDSLWHSSPSRRTSSDANGMQCHQPE